MVQKESTFSYPIERFLGLNINTNDRTSLKKGESSYMKNFEITDSYTLKKRSGYRQLYDFGDKTRAVFTTVLDSECIFVVAGNSVFKADMPFNGHSVKNVGSVADSGNCFFMRFGGQVYLWGGGKIQVYDTDTEKFTDITPYRPLIALSCSAETGVGTPFEGVNMLTAQIRRQYVINDTTHSFKIFEESLKSVDFVKHNGNTVPDRRYWIDNETNHVRFYSDYPSFKQGEIIEIGYTLNDSDALKENLGKIVNCRYSMFYGGENDTKVFLWGNPDYPDTRFWSEAQDGIPSAVYFPENNFTRIGDGEQIRDIVRQYDRQLIFCDNSAYLSYIETRTDEVGRNYFSFPVRTISDTKGSHVSAQSKLINNSPVTLCRDGLYEWASTLQRDERNTVKLSSRIDEALQKEDIENAKMFDYDYKNELYIYFPSGRVYVYRYKTDVFYMYDNIFAHTFFTLGDTRLYFSDAHGKVFVFDQNGYDGESPTQCEWHSGFTDIGYYGYKNLYNVGITYNPQENTSFDIGWTTDSDADIYMTKVDIPDSKAASDGRAAKFKKHRMRTKRFRYIKLVVKDSSQNGPIHIHRITLNGRYTCI